MKQTRKTRQAAARQKTSQPSGAAQPSRRNVLKLLRNGAIGGVVLAGGGYIARGSFQAHAAEHDLSRLGQGKPVVVQIHDPQCPTCTSLQRETRKALKEFGECDIVYLVADIMTEKGAAFAAKYGVPHVTLLLFDGAGDLQQTLQGMRQRDELQQVFTSHHAAST
ncbi:thioredoxin family protein [Ascidiaceihabitans sp.]|uniref:thioredoxin family protein n=1 Tax=Ascidiaceihabitans sp. TaxID=1872644 RepID=UPI003298B2AD